MNKPFDTSLKSLFRTHPQDLGTLLGIDEPIGPEPLATNLTANLDTDLAFLFGSPPRGILDINFQTAWDGETLVRLFTYNTLLYREHRLPVHSVVILLRSRENDLRLDAGLRYAIWSERGSMTFIPEVIRAWELPQEQLLTGGVGLLPLAVIGRPPDGMTRLEALPGVIAAIQRRLSAGLTEDAVEQLWNSVYNIAGIYFDPEEVKKMIYHTFDMPESKTYQDTLMLGQLRHARNTLFRLGEPRIGKPDERARTMILGIGDLSTLDRMLDTVVGAKNWDEVLETI